MAFRDPQPIALTRQAVLLVTAVGVGLIAMSYILGVQVGKGSANLRRPEARSVDEQLKELPEPLLDQLNLFKATEAPESPKPAETKTSPAVPTEAKLPEELPAKDSPTPIPAAVAKPGTSDRWTLQLLSTPQKAEAERLAERAKAAGFPARVLLEDKAWKVRLSRSAAREVADATAERLRSAGFKPFAVRAESP